MTTVLLVRRGETAWNRERRVQGWAPTSLTDRGREQAAAVGRDLRRYDPDHLVASDLDRCKETARLLRRAADFDAEPRFSTAWRERSFGVYQGLTYEELFDGHPEFAVGECGRLAAGAVPEAGESLLDARERVLDGWRALLDAAGPGDTAVVVTHGGPIYLLLGHLKGLDVVAAVDEQSQRNCAVTEVSVEDGTATVVREDDSTWRETDDPTASI